MSADDVRRHRIDYSTTSGVSWEVVAVGTFRRGMMTYEFASPWLFCVTGDNEIYVSDTSNHRVAQVSFLIGSRGGSLGAGV